MASGTALGRAGRLTAHANPTGKLAAIAGDPDKVTGETVFEAARLGDPGARELFDQLGYWLGAGIASLVTLFDPEIVIIAGGLVTTGDLLLIPTRTSFQRFVFARDQRKLPPILPARLGADAGVIGAALLALDRHADRADPNTDTDTDTDTESIEASTHSLGTPSRLPQPELLTGSGPQT
jgi:glucokinase